MHQFVLKIFKFLKSLIHLFKILIVFFIMMLMIYWAQNLSSSDWGITNFISPFLDLLIDFGNMINSNSFNLFSAVFEYKYFIAFIILLIFYAFCKFLDFFVENLKEFYLKTRKHIKKVEENLLNKSLENQVLNEQKKLKKYQIFVSTSIKNNLKFAKNNVDINEQNKIMLKFLIEKTCCTPKTFENGFLFEFNSFDNVDNVLDCFTKLITSKAPLDYVICMQIFGENYTKENEQLLKMKDLKILNKIVSFADTSYRYSFNKEKSYNISMIGVFQKDNQTFELYEYIKTI